MNALLFHNCNLRNFGRLKSVLSPYRTKNSNLLHFKRHCTNTSTNSSKCLDSTKGASLIQKIGIGLSISGGLFSFSLYNNNVVLCKSRISQNRLAGYRTMSDKDAKFDWQKFWSYLEPHTWYLLAAILGTLIVAILNIQIPRMMGEVINVVAKYSNDLAGHNKFFQDMKIPAFKLIIMYIAQSTFTFFYIFMLSKIGENVALKMRTDLFNSILKQDIAFFDEQRTGELVNRLTADIQDFKSSFKQIISGGLRAVTQILGCAASLIIISPHMTFITLLCVPSVIAAGTFIGSKLRNTSRTAQNQIEKATAIADEAISNIRTVRAFAMEDQENELFRKEAETAMVYNEQLGFGIGLFQAGTNLFLNGMVLSTLYMGGYLLSTNQLSAGDLMAYLMATQTIQRSLAQISLLFGSVIRGLSAGSRVFQYINLEPNMRLRGGVVLPTEEIKGEIQFKNVTFSYPTRPDQKILHKFNLMISSGKTVAIVGSSGNGKSTIVALLERFYDTDGGIITLDGHDLKSLDPSWLRGNVLGLISQEPVLFGTTILENIRYGKPDASDEQVEEAAKLANAHNFIKGFPDAYNTIVGERGIALSGGQKQRVAIARALLKNPSVLLLDEATSALDTESEKVVQTALEQAAKGRTVLVIAHRLSTIQNADIIVVLHKGRIVEMGTHEELKNLKGYYWALNFQQHEDPPAG
ncbi:ATP-binding cassette sub-family B member 8, mitochondrial [Agrilus planipennis]|uniref:Mitochondrial potassium channel ATP-binding subunit n=1 Tax=Agrilus planipennis TaxID=224129 RepID=A0A7F5RI84_AGRPL|nr:ATP-binding cassette sub-family B member 8, mitochondrial [Agrilus planipennis]